MKSGNDELLMLSTTAVWNVACLQVIGVKVVNQVSEVGDALSRRHKRTSSIC